MEKCLVIHGHFYQPPRENAWTESIVRQDSAYPYHDWNERINAECYRPNAFARILDHSNRIVNIVNNYAQVSFNFGPTLLSWLERYSPATYHRILEADRLSQERCHGHGNAIAQAYNHAILPLCNARDKVTQVRWGIADFRYRFGREPEAMWLPETAANDATLRVLIDQGMKFVILSPHQAKRIRNFTITDVPTISAGETNAAPPQTMVQAYQTGEWIGVEHGEIDTHQAYRWFDKDTDGHPMPERHLDIFFYDGGLSRGVSFEHLARDARNFAERIDNCFSNNAASRSELVSLATDGETYGHHERHSDMGLAYLLNVEAPRREIRITNYAEFLAENPPVMEVEIKEGPNGEGTAWSCAHGVGRWYSDCGCRGDGPPEWTQEWRGPLRQTFDNLRDELAALTLEQGEDLLKDVWEARNDYIEVILPRLSFEQNGKSAEESLARFLDKHQKRPLSDAERLVVIHLMEMQRQTQLMYTSCGWFFTELSGIETVQVIQYAARAVRLAEHISPDKRGTYEARFLSDLKKARSNHHDFKNGEGVYRKLVRPLIVSFMRLVNTHAIRTLFAGAPAQEQLYHYTINRTDLVEKRTEDTTFMIGRAEVESGTTTVKRAYAFALVNRGAGVGVKSFVKREDGTWNYAESREALINDFHKLEDDILDILQQRWGGETFGLGDMLAEERQHVINILLQDRLSEISGIYSHIYTQYRSLMQALRGLGAMLPAELSVPARYTLSQRLREEVEKLRNVTDPEAYKPCLEVARAAQRLGLQLDNQSASHVFQGMIEARLHDLLNSSAAASCKEILALVDIADRLKLELDEPMIQNQIFSILQERIDSFIDRIFAASQIEREYDYVSDFLRLAYRFNFNIKRYKDRLKPLEQAWSQDPRYWP